ncbi:MAG: 5-formyltetrahydrofolate cyclo-ligase [Myxococcota bacterium]
MTADPRKTALRRALRARRAAQEPGIVTEASAALTARVRAHSAWRSAGSVAAFVGVRGEPNTHALLEAALAEGRQLWLPRVLHGRAGESVLVQVDTLDQLAPAGFGLLEPRPHPGEQLLTTVNAKAPLDLILVPGLAFSSRGDRIGFGAGHYDRLLAPVARHLHPIRMGVCLSSFLDPAEGPIPTASHDVSMHWIATEHGLLDARPESADPRDSVSS